MKALKVILGILGVLIAGYLVLCLVGPKQLDVSTSTEIEAPASVVYNQIYQLENWEDWGPWQQMDPSMVTTYSEPTSGVGSSYSWTSDNMGEGSLEVTEADPPNSMKTKISFGEGRGYGYGTWDLEENEGKTKVTWGMTSDQTPFMQRGIMVLMGMTKTIKENFDDGLASIKEITETEVANMPTTYGGYEVKVADHTGHTFASVRKDVNMTEIADFLAAGYGTVMGAMAAKEVPMSGAPGGLYFTWDEETSMTNMAAAIPIAEAVELGDGIEVVSIPAGKSLTIDYYGPYDGVGAAHEAMEAYCKANNIEPTLPCLESYVTDPTTEEDPSKWLTHVVYFY